MVVIEDEEFVINQIRKYLELILLGKKLEFDGDLSKYIRNS